ncbi:MAG: hypothetical protein AB1Z98_10290 [Nannocystaceae bacterium]
MRMSLGICAVVLGSSVFASCLVEDGADPSDERDRSAIKTFEGHSAQLVIEEAVERVPLGEVQTKYVEAEDGSVVEVHSQDFEIIFEDGTVGAASITCNHSGCGGECGTSGCLPNATGTGCTGASCGAGIGCSIQSPKCSHSATAELTMAF